ncbi:Gfo/Idh/MocA family oxidoreductase [Labrys monachus]|uniref:Inositol 2-dehydrogenase n=1 Tax=Labrys monachus TaxID=217067 RepID=A0ABU0FH62_9HYPH|nr:Gfo/Idh/MocA family oxidoreductase [Labrys monachus]MDQ0393949.1 myo-inositol 2-dehydrogenase/D-chiro-inositol 1-dehydrogenase [Labrys monachus]
MTLRIGVIGTGVMGADHARTIRRHVARAEVAALCDPDADRAGVVAGEIAGARLFSDPLALIADPGIDAVVVASPDETHAECVLACIAAGKPVLCEKPLAAGAADCLRVVEAERAAGRRLVQVGFMRRFDPAYNEMRQRLASGDFGEALMLHCAHRNASVPAFFRSLMSITNAAVHEFDIVRWLLDAEIVEIEVMKPRPTRSSAAADPLFIVMRTDKDQLVDVEIFMNAGYGYDIRTELVCEKGTLTMAPPVHAEQRIGGTQRFPFAPDWRPRFAEAYRRQMQAWVDSIGTDRPVGAGAWDGLVATAIAEAGVRAFEEGGVIKVALPRF